MADISKITLPNGQTYNIKDEVARQAAAAGLVIQVVTTLPTASASTLGIIYLVAHEHGTSDIYDEYITVSANDTYTWEKIGNTDIDLSNYSQTGHTHSVTSNVAVGNHSYTPAGTNKASTVSFGSDGGSATVLTSSVTATVPKPSYTTRYLTAAASGTAIDVATSASAITALGTPSTETFVKSYPGATKKLATTSVPNVTSAGSTGSAASWSASVTNETLSFSWTANTPTTAPTLGTAITVATGKVASSDSNGDSVMTGLGTASTASGVTGLGTPSTDTFAQTVSVTTQPTISLTENTSTKTGAITYVKSASTSGTNSVTFDTATAGKTASAITSLPTATAAAQEFTGTAATLTHSVTNNAVTSGTNSK